MKIYFTVDEDGFLNNGYSSTPSYDDGEISLEIDKGHELFEYGRSSYAFKYVDGELIFNEERQQQLIEEYEREKNKPSETDVLAMAVMDLAELVLNGGGK